jgi:hypothetical protein
LQDNFDNKDFGQALDADIDLVTDLRFILEAQHKTDLQLERNWMSFLNFATKNELE